MRIKIAFAIGLAFTAVAVSLTLLHSPETVAYTNGIQPTAVLGATTKNAGACQADETLPADTSAIRLQIEATTGPRVTVEVFDGAHLITRGTKGTAWYGSAVTVPVKPLNRTSEHARVCFQVDDLTGLISLYGAPTIPADAANANGQPLPGRLRVVYLQPSGESWWSLAGGVIHHMGLGRAASGTWIVFPIAALTAAAIAVAFWALARELQ